MKYIINGRFLSEKITGIQRYAYEITRELDKIVDHGKVEIYVPNDTSADMSIYKNIKVINSNKPSGQLWEQVHYCKYLRDQKAFGINLCNVVPLMYPRGIACIHDINYKVIPDAFKGGFITLDGSISC